MRTENKETAIELVDLSIGYDTRTNKKVVASNINASVRQGELTCLLGANGVGKSTLLRTITANQPQLNGQIFFQGVNLSQFTTQSLASLISVVLTEKVDVKNMTVFEMVSMGRYPFTGFWGTLRDEDHQVIEEAIKLVGIDHLSSRMIQTLSDGERQKTMIAKALAQQTPIILLDEPTAFLDFPSKIDMMKLLHRLSRETNKTIFLSTHDLDLALQIADQVWIMDKEYGIRTGTPEDLALSGALSLYFERKGIMFDKQSGLFKIENHIASDIKVDGEGQLYAMVCKALLRNGILACSHQTDSNQIHIEVSDSQIVVHFKEQPSQTVHSVEELLKLITA